jgi:hypothetical protein
MTLLDQINVKFKLLLQAYSKGISNTSTNKYDEIRAQLSSDLSLATDDVYVTGAAERISNLDTRLPQGNLRNQHTALGVAFIQMPSKGRKREDVISQSASSAKTTVEKFVCGQERGTTFDGVLCFLQVDQDDKVEPLFFLHSQHCTYVSGIRAGFPGIPVEDVYRSKAPALPSSTGSPATGSTGSDAKIVTIDATLATMCSAAMAEANLRIPAGLVERFLSSLLVKRFVILSGLSGSGKTKLALAIAKWFQEVEQQVEVVAVGSDWTSNESVLGYHDALETTRYRRPANGALDLMLAARDDPSRPYFLILDEMNLSHVERYFADILSAIESGEAISLHSVDGEVEGVPARLSLPNNMFIIGTVNVDETTYMFSPKVLDRANVIEFRVPRALVSDFLGCPVAVDVRKITSRGACYSSAFVEATRAADADVAVLPTSIVDGLDVKNRLNERLLTLFDLLAPVGAEFGFRSAREIHRFVYFHALLSGPGWNLERAVDAQLLQKLMPKLHGPERRLGPILAGLLDFSENNGCPMSRDKIFRMQARLRDGFASFLDP